MLKALSIKNIALIDQLEIDFSSGLNILSGETGAGKSIIIDSLNFVLGARADKSLIRYNTDMALVEAEFVGSISSGAKAKLADYEIDSDDGVIVSRSLSTDGRNVCRVNGIKVSATVLKDIASLLVDIYGQHDTTQLLNQAAHLPIIDSYGKHAIEPVQSAFASRYSEYKAIIATIKKYGSLTNVNKRMETVQEDIGIIESAKLKVGEEAQLEDKLKLIESSEDIINAIDEVEDYLGGSGGAIRQLNQAVRSIGDIVDVNENVSSAMSRLESAYYEVADIAEVLRREKSKVNYDEYELGKVNTRLNKIREVIVGYGGDEASALSKLVELNAEFDFLANSEYEVIQLNKAKVIAEHELYAAAVALTNARRTVALEFESSVLAELSELSMARTKFKVEFAAAPAESDYLAHVTGQGIDSIEFLISPNPGQPLKPLSKIISGGEMSRFMLAIKKLTADIDGVNVMVFDEVDTGISGDVALVVAQKLSELSRGKQVLAITHLPQLASFADAHYYIDKVSDDDTTKSSLTVLDSEGMVRELARLIGGSKDSNTSLIHAREIKAAADKYKSR